MSPRVMFTCECCKKRQPIGNFDCGFSGLHHLNCRKCRKLNKKDSIFNKISRFLNRLWT